MINHDLLKAWLKNLRSGEYKQGKGHLNGPDGFCCLGALCDTKDPTKWEEYKGIKSWGLNTIALSPPDLNEEVGLDINAVYELARMNDAGYTFNEIADWIEEHVPNA